MYKFCNSDTEVLKNPRVPRSTQKNAVAKFRYILNNDYNYHVPTLLGNVLSKMKDRISI